MPSLREEITKTFTRLARLGEVRADAHKMPPEPDPREGRQFGIYDVVRRLGSGGMGQVYLAFDRRLARQVALKFLAPELVADQTSLMRLVQEARAASALNHPNILTIYDVGEIDGEHFIVSEFVDGVTLRTAMETRALTAELSIEIASQVASALSAAHAAGVVHRDLKPTNIMLRPDGYVKVIDFGLAKRLASFASAETQVMQAELTQPGTTLGTAEYMSPEQARGQAVDYRTDIWSLGVILYEMLAGRRPFEGPTASHILVAIQDQAMPPLPEGESLQPGIAEVLRRALAKKPADRYSSAAEMLYALQAASGTPSGSRIRIASLPGAASKRGLTKVIVYSGVAVLVLCAIAIVWYQLRRPQWIRLEPLRQLTFNGRVQLDAISPDGKYLAYTVGQPDGEQALYLKQIDSPSDELKIPPRRINYRGLTFAADNQTLYVVEKDEAFMGRLYAVPLLGTRPNIPIVVDIDGPVSFSPTGDRFVYVQHKPVKGSNGSSTENLLMLASREGQSRRALVSTTDAYMFRQPVWSADGKRIAVFLQQADPGKLGRHLLDIVSLNGSELRRVIPDWQTIGQPQWTTDSRSLIVGSVLTYSHPDRRYQMEQLFVPTGAEHALTSDLAAYSEVSLARDGTRMLAIKADSKAVIWISRRNDFNHGDTLPAEAERDPALIWADAAHLVVNSRRNGFPNLGLLDTQTQSFSPLTNEQFVEQGAAIIPGTGGRSVVFASNRSGQFHIWRFDAEANSLRQLTSGPNYEEHPSVSPDGRWVVYTAWAENVPQLWKVPTEGGPAARIGSYSAKDPQLSPDGKWIACYLHNQPGSKSVMAVLPFDGNGEPRLVPQASSPARWSPDSASLTSVRTDARGVSNVWRIPLNGGAPMQLTAFEDQSIPAFAWSSGGERLACLRVSVGADVMLFKLDKQR